MPGIHCVYTHHRTRGAHAEGAGDLDLRVDEVDFWTTDASSTLLEELTIALVRCIALERQFHAAPGGRK